MIFLLLLSLLYFPPHPSCCADPPFPTIIPVNESHRLLLSGDFTPSKPTSQQPHLLLLFTGDTQYHYPCTDQNRECKRRSRECYIRHRLLHNRTASTSPHNGDDDHHFDECTRLESTYANEAQRKSIFELNRRLSTKPAALVINGDLTNYGHTEQLNLFKSEWLTLPMAVYAGLGNHDYENNVNDCVANQCANNMLYWFVNQYSTKMNLTLDYKKSALLWKTRYEGSLAYSMDFCSSAEGQEETGVCVHLIQLNNRPDYAASISSASEWTITGSFQWLVEDLNQVSNRTWPILINLHNHSAEVGRRLKKVLEQWMTSNQQNSGILRRVMVLFAHIHEDHGMKRAECIGGVQVPHFYVGSVPNNRYSAIRFEGNGGERALVFLLQANANSTTTIVRSIDWVWKPC